MVETSARLLQLLSLFQGRRYWSGGELAERLAITVRTLRRDVDKLRSLGYPIHSNSGAEGGYQLGAGTQMPPLLLDDSEAVAVAVGLRCAASGAIEGVEDASVSALAKIEQILPPRLSRRVRALQWVVVASSRWAGAVDAQSLAILAGACRDHEQLRFRYNDHSGKASLRCVEPHRLVNTGRRWYLVAWDTVREDWRTFRVDRVQPKVSAGDRFVPKPPPAEDLAAYVGKGIGAATRCRARIRFLASEAEVADRVPSCVGLIEAVDKHSCYFETGSSSYEALASHLVWMGVDFELSGPEELVREVRKIGERYRRASAKRR